MPTPLYDCLKNYAESGPARFHMPGHKGHTMPVPELAAVAPIDLTEITPTGNLFEAGEPFDSAQQLWADLMGFDCCQFLTNGSTGGIHTGLTLLAKPGDRILCDRGCHRAVFNAMSLLDLHPVYMERPWLAEHNQTAHFTVADIEKQLNAHPDIKTVCITSPTYSGLLSDIPGIAKVIHDRGGRLFVDGAHGAHLAFLGIRAYTGADVVVVSAHKTLPALGQTALLFVNGIDHEEVRRAATIYNTSSPSYPMTASMDVARQWLVDHPEEYQRAAAQVARLREKYPSLKGLPMDPARLTVKVKNGEDFAQKLEKMGIYPEMDDGGHVVFICTAMDTDEDFARLEAALDSLREEMGDCAPIPAPPMPEQVLSPREALLLREKDVLPLSECEGRVSSCQLAPYPPGVPVVAPGERITKKELSYLKQIGYNKKDVQVVHGNP